MFFPLGRTQYVVVGTYSGRGDALYESTIDSVSSPSTINLNLCVYVGIVHVVVDSASTFLKVKKGWDKSFPKR